MVARLVAAALATKSLFTPTLCLQLLTPLWGLLEVQEREARPALVRQARLGAILRWHLITPTHRPLASFALRVEEVVVVVQ